MRRFILNRITFLLVIIVIIIPLVLLFLERAEGPPLHDLKKARIAINDAKKSNAQIYQKKLIAEADAYYDSSFAEIKRQNEIFILKRDYSKSTYYAIKSKEKASEANRLATLKGKNLKKYVEFKIDSVESFVKEFKTLFVQLPLEKKILGHFSKGDILLGESKLDFRNGKFSEAEKKINLSYNHINIAYTEAKTMLTDYFIQYESWIGWVDDAVSQSKKDKKKLIVIDKFSKKIYLYKNGKQNYTTDVELGKNWIGDKNYSGDKATPEGKYKIVKKIDKPHTKYHKALLLDYPNADDVKRFNHAKTNGKIPANSKIGGLIEIHGSGGKGINWTDGCIAVHDTDMNKIFSFSETGTEVVIVGSLLSLSEILN